MICLQKNGAEMEIALLGAEMRAYRSADGKNRIWSGRPRRVEKHRAGAVSGDRGGKGRQNEHRGKGLCGAPPRALPSFWILR